MATDTWDPDQYHRFASERARPFHDLLAMVGPVPGGRVVDLGCGAGELTVQVHEHTGAATTLGLDTSAAMLEKAAGLERDGLHFEQADLRTAREQGPWDLAFSNAVLHWVPDHRRLIRDIAASIGPGGQLAVQVPANFDHPSHTVAAEVLRRTEYSEAGGAKLVTSPGHHILKPEEYAELLDELGFVEQRVRLEVYGVVLESTASIVEWTSGTLLTPVRSALASDPERYDRFVDDYRSRLVEVVGDHAPYFFAFKRILFWARKPAA